MCSHKLVILLAFRLNLRRLLQSLSFFERIIQWTTYIFILVWIWISEWLFFIHLFDLIWTFRLWERLNTSLQLFMSHKVVFFHLVCFAWILYKSILKFFFYLGYLQGSPIVLQDVQFVFVVYFNIKLLHWWSNCLFMEFSLFLLALFSNNGLLRMLRFCIRGRRTFLFSFQYNISIITFNFIFYNLLYLLIQISSYLLFKVFF